MQRDRLVNEESFSIAAKSAPALAFDLARANWVNVK
jgi:hypothetical protein